MPGAIAGNAPVREADDERACRANPIAGWPLPILARWDRDGARGLLGDLVAAGALTRQACYVVAAMADLDVTAFLRRLGIGSPGAEGIGLALRTRHAREVIAAAYAVSPNDVPPGYLRALARVQEAGSSHPGLDSFREPQSYKALFDILFGDRHGRRAHALRYCKGMQSSFLDAAIGLDPVLVCPEIVGAIGTEKQVERANALLRLLRSSVSTMTDDDLVLALRRSLSDGNLLENFARKVMDKADRLPEPPFPAGNGLRPLTSATEIREFGAAMSNCAASKVVEVALGLLQIYEVRQQADDGKEYVVAVSLMPMINNLWTVSEVKGRKNKHLPAPVQRAVLKKFEALGALIPGPSLQSRYRSDLAGLLGAYRWNAVDECLRGNDETDEDDFDDALNEIA